MGNTRFGRPQESLPEDTDNRPQIYTYQTQFTSQPAQLSCVIVRCRPKLREKRIPTHFLLVNSLYSPANHLKLSVVCLSPHRETRSYPHRNCQYLWLSAPSRKLHAAARMCSSTRSTISGDSRVSNLRPNNSGHSLICGQSSSVKTLTRGFGPGRKIRRP